MSEIPYMFSAKVTEISNIDLWIMANSEKEAREKIAKRDFNWDTDTKHCDYEKSEISEIILTKVDGEPVKGE